MRIYIAIILAFAMFFCADAQGRENTIAVILLEEPAGLPRDNEYIEVYMQLDASRVGALDKYFVLDPAKGDSIPCQVLEKKTLEKENLTMLSLIFPVSLKADERKELFLKPGEVREKPTDLTTRGEGLDLIVENRYYRADLDRDESVKSRNYNSGQLRALFIKMGFDQLFSRNKIRMQWSPNFKKSSIDHYTTVAHWDPPRYFSLRRGPYLVQTERQDAAPGHPEILLSAAYKFYADKPYFRFYSSMEMVQDVMLDLLRNDEMTMDSLFTHVAFQRPDGEIVDLAFSERYDVLKKRPIENRAPWLCFYNRDKGYAFGSIRLKYDIADAFGRPSPTYDPYTKVSDGAGGGKYWDRLLIHTRPTFVPKGSRYIEENAYIVFKIDDEQPFRNLLYYADRLLNPVTATVKF